jgi:hypothetical protein
MQRSFHIQLHLFFTSLHQTGALSLVSDEGLREWNPKKHILNSALVFLKKIFYLKSFYEIEYVANEEARQLYAP